MADDGPLRAGSRLDADQGLLSHQNEAGLCVAWAAFWLVCHFACSLLPSPSPSAGASSSEEHDAKRLRSGIPQQRGAYLRRIYRSQIYCFLAVAGALRLLTRCRRLPEDLLEDFGFEHQVFFSMAVGHWAVSLWEDSQSWTFLSSGLDGKALRGVRDPAQLLLQAYAIHHIVACSGYTALLRIRRVAGIGTMGLLFELPVIFLNRRELALLGATASRWLNDRAGVQQHWHFTYLFFFLARGGPTVLYVYSVICWSQQLEQLRLVDKFVYHGMVIFFSVLNYSFMTVLEAWARRDAQAVQRCAVDEDDEDEEAVDSGSGADSERFVDPEAAPLREVDQEVFASKAGESGDEVWIAIEGFVYDVARFLQDHPGGADVLRSWAGRDATEAFVKVCNSPAAQASMTRYMVGPLRCPPSEYRIFEHVGEEQEVKRLVAALVFGFGLQALALRALSGSTSVALASSSPPVVSALLSCAAVGLLAMVLPLSRRVGGPSAAAAKGGGGWRSHAVALAFLWCQVGLFAAVLSPGSGWAPVLGPAAPGGLELTAAALLATEALLSPARAGQSALGCGALLAASWFFRGLGPSSLTMP
ncbi:unnamed protein product, partial [Polarella glacialis]